MARWVLPAIFVIAMVVGAWALSYIAMHMFVLI